MEDECNVNVTFVLQMVVIFVILIWKSIDSSMTPAEPNIIAELYPRIMIVLLKTRIILQKAQE